MEKNLIKELEDAIKNAMIDTGRIESNWRIKITGKERVNKNSDYVRVFVNVYKPYSRKPDVMWDLCINIVKDLLYWEHSTFYNCK